MRGRPAKHDFTGTLPIAGDVQLGASLLAADPINLQSEVATVADADYLHVDLFDDRFVRGVSWGEGTLKRVVETTSIPVEVHLMVEDAAVWGAMARKAGCDRIIFHIESSEDPVAVAELLGMGGAVVSVAISPGTDPAQLADVLPLVASVLVMTVEPGAGGSGMLPGAEERVAEVRRLIDGSGLNVEVAVDGGVTVDNGRGLACAGATRMVMGTGLFGADDRAARISDFRRIVGGLHFNHGDDVA